MKKKKNLDKPFNFRLNDKVVLVTGASRGIGYEVSKSFLMNGSNLIICSKNLKKLRKSYLSLKKIKKKIKKYFILKLMYHLRLK